MDFVKSVRNNSAYGLTVTFVTFDPPNNLLPIYKKGNFSYNVFIIISLL